MAVFALGETRCATTPAVAALTAGLADVDELVRSNSAFSLGSLARVAALPATAIDALLTRLDPQREPDNTNSANMSRSTVRECVVHALLQAACNGRLHDRQRQRLAAAGLADPDRYVRGLTVQALRRDPNGAIPDWLDQVLVYLDTHQYQPSPQ
jgi:HEAT repeat protein